MSCYASFCGIYEVFCSLGVWFCELRDKKQPILQNWAQIIHVAHPSLSLINIIAAIIITDGTFGFDYTADSPVCL